MAFRFVSVSDGIAIPDGMAPSVRRRRRPAWGAGACRRGVRLLLQLAERCVRAFQTSNHSRGAGWWWYTWRCHKWHPALVALL